MELAKPLGMGLTTIGQIENGSLQEIGELIMAEWKCMGIEWCHLLVSN